MGRASALVLAGVVGCVFNPEAISANAEVTVEIRGIPEQATSLRIDVRDLEHSHLRTPVPTGSSLTIRVDHIFPGPGEARVEAWDRDGRMLGCRAEGFVHEEGLTKVLVSLADHVGLETICSDGVDNDCDGIADCADDDDCRNEVRPCVQGACDGVQTCLNGTWGACAVQTSQEKNVNVCDDGRDNDCDGAIDCADSDCACSNCGC